MALSVLWAGLALAGCSSGAATGPGQHPATTTASSPLPLTTQAGSTASAGQGNGGSCRAPVEPEPAGTILGQWQGTGSRTVSFSSCQDTWGLADIWNCPSSASGSNHTVAAYQLGDTTAQDLFGGELGPGQGIDSWGTPEFSQVAPPATGPVSIRLSFPAACQWQLRAVAGGTPPPAWAPSAG